MRRWFSEAILNIDTLLITLTSGSEREISDLPYDIVNIHDSTVLVELAGNLNRIVSIANSSIWDSNKDKIKIQASIEQIIKFLRLVLSSGCRCSKYSIYSYYAYAEAKRGLVEILENHFNQETFESNIECKCTVCGQEFSVYEREAGFGRRAVWKAKN